LGHSRRYGDVRSLVVIDGTEHYHVRPRPCVCGLPASDPQTTGTTAAAPVSVELANMTHVRPPKSRYSRCNGSARKLLPGRFAWFLSDRNFRERQHRTGDSIVSSAPRFLLDCRRIARSPEEFLQLGDVGVAPQLPCRRQ